MQTESDHSIRPLATGGHDLTPDQDLAAVLLGPSVTDAAIDGLDIEAAARSLGVAQDDVWRRIRNGQLMARTERGKVFVYTSIQSPEAVSTALVEDSTPPLPTPPVSETLLQLQETLNSFPTTNTMTVSHQDMTLLIDHMNLTKEENREILRLTRDSMARLSSMTDSMLAMKNDLIAAREHQVETLNERLDQQTEKMRKLQRDKEDLETLTRVLSTHIDL